jgi:hypothetical protein
MPLTSSRFDRTLERGRNSLIATAASSRWSKSSHIGGPRIRSIDAASVTKAMIVLRSSRLSPLRTLRAALAKKSIIQSNL